MNWVGEPVEAECLTCGQKFAGGTMQYRSLDAYDDNPEPYCPVCDDSNFKFFEVE